MKPGRGQGTETVKVDTRDREMKGYSQDSLLATCRVTVDGLRMVLSGIQKLVKQD